MEIVVEVKRDSLYCGETIDRPASVNFITKSSDRTSDKLYFANEPDIIRYCKAQLIKELHNAIREAEMAINGVREFRIKHGDKLNLTWTDEAIRNLERQLQ